MSIVCANVYKKFIFDTGFNKIEEPFYYRIKRPFYVFGSNKKATRSDCFLYLPSHCKFGYFGAFGFLILYLRVIIQHRLGFEFAKKVLLSADFRRAAK